VPSSRPATTDRRAGAGDVPHENEVRLVGRLAAEPVSRELPSGDLLVTFRLVVARRAAARTPGAAAARSPSVDTIDCTAWRKDVQRTLRRAAAGDVLEVEGALRRRFWRGAGGPASRSEVEVGRVRRSAAGR
jgi:single-strand DNA-binding protein